MARKPSIKATTKQPSPNGKKGKACPDVAKCAGLDQLIQKAQTQIKAKRDEATRKRIQQEQAAAQEKKRSEEAAKDDAAFDFATEVGTKEAYEAYLRLYSKGGRHANEAKTHIEEVEEATEWKAAQTNDNQEGYNTYLKKYPFGKYANEARTRIAEMEEADEWKAAQSSDSKVAYDNYLAKYPNGKFVHDAHRCIDKLDQQEIKVSDNFISALPGYLPEVGDLFDEGDSDEKPVRDVTGGDFYLSPYEVTFDEYDTFAPLPAETKPPRS